MPRLLSMFGRALRLRYPSCGKGNPFGSRFRMRSHCEVCGLAFERGEDGYQVGSYMFNIVASAPPWTLLQHGGIALMAVVPFVLFPFTKTLFLAFDLIFRPADS